jgi:hypothetical protein
MDPVHPYHPGSIPIIVRRLQLLSRKDALRAPASLLDHLDP